MNVHHLKIGPYDYDVVEDDEFVDKLTSDLKARVENSGLVAKTDEMHELSVSGYTDEETLTIALRSGNKQVQDVTLLHEALHALIGLAGLSDTITGDQEESISERLGPLLYQFLIDNREVLDEHLR